MQWLILIGIGVIWLIFKIFEGISDSATAYQNSKKSKEEREKKYGGRTIDTSKTLFERNVDIVEQFADKIHLNNSYGRHSYYYLDNETRDCINEICSAENRHDIMPGSSYLSFWRSSAPAEWVKLAEQVESKFKKKQTELHDANRQKEREKREREEKANQLEREIRKVKKDFDDRKSKRVAPSSLRKITQRKERGDIDIGIMGMRPIFLIILCSNIIPGLGIMGMRPIFLIILCSNIIPGLGCEFRCLGMKILDHKFYILIGRIPILFNWTHPHSFHSFKDGKNHLGIMGMRPIF